MKRASRNHRHSSTRRSFLASGSALAAGLAAAAPSRAAGRGGGQAESETLAAMGGPRAVQRPQEKADRWPLYGPEEEQAVLELIRKPGYAPNAALAKDWKQHFGVEYVTTYCNGTSALTSMFFALDLPAGSEIMVPSYTFFATIVPMRLFGLVPVFVDIDPHTLNFDLNDAKKRLTKNTKAVLPVHWFGRPCDMDDICDWAKEKGLIVLEDACHAHGASLKGKYMGSWGVMGAFSLQQTKPLPGIEGGIGVFQTREHYERASSFGHYDIGHSFGQESPYYRYEGTGLGLKLRMHPVCAALARVQLKNLERRNTEGAAQVRSLNDRLLELPGLVEQGSRPDAKRLYYAANMLFIDERKAGFTRDQAVKALQAEGVTARAYSYRLQHKCALYAEANWWHHPPQIPDLPGSEEANRTGIALPYFTSPVPDLLDQYVKAFQKVWAHRSGVATL